MNGLHYIPYIILNWTASSGPGAKNHLSPKLGEKNVTTNKTKPDKTENNPCPSTATTGASLKNNIIASQCPRDRPAYVTVCLL